MSRCFPFPPPGYVKKTRTEDIDLLKKEKHREKKHKKDKRDKEKKESKEKREKDRSDEKQKEKKEKKEKHRDKKKDRDKTRDKDKNNHVTSDEKKIMGHTEPAKGEKNYDKSKEREKAKSGTVLGEKIMGNSIMSNGVVLGKNIHVASENKNFKQLHELGNKIPIEEGKRSILFAEKYPSAEIKKDVGMPRMGVTTPATPMATSERSKERKVSDVRMDRHGPGAGGRPSENVLVQRVVQNRVEGVARQVEKNADRRVEVREKIRGIEGDGKKGEKRKYEDREKSIEKYKEKDKRIKVERPIDMGGEMLVEQSRTKDNKVHADLLRGKDGNKKDFLVAQSASPAKLLKEDDKAAAATTEILRKRKGFGPSAVFHEGDVGLKKMPRITSSSFAMTENGRRPSLNSTTVSAPVKQQLLSNAKQDEADVVPNKMARITSSSPPIVENGRTLQPSQDFKASSKIKKDYKDRGINGSRTDQNSGAMKKLLPHPDTKYLSQVLSVPKMEEWCEFDEQEWLFSSSLNKPKAEISRVDDTIPQVWAEALRIESADVYALPYVIPR